MLYHSMRTYLMSYFYKRSGRQSCRLLSIWLLPLAFKLLHTWHCIFGGILLYIFYNKARVELNFVTILKRIFKFQIINFNYLNLFWTVKSTVRKLDCTSGTLSRIPLSSPQTSEKLDLWRTGFLICPSNLDFWLGLRLWQ